jgi:hypothetical protein
MRDVGVIERGQRLRLTRGAGEALRIVRERPGQHLDRNIAVERRIPRAIHLAHPAGAERRDDLVRA